MKSRIDEALDYLGGSDHRYQTTLIGGLLVLVAQYVFVYADSSSVVVRTVGVVSVAILVGYVLLVIGQVSDGNDQPPRFVPVTIDRGKSIVINGVIGLALVDAVIGVMYQLLQIALSRFQNWLGPVGSAWPLNTALLTAMNWSTYVYVLFLVPYVVVAVLLIYGRTRLWSSLRSLWDSEHMGVTRNLVVGLKTVPSELGLLVSREYAYAWLLAVVLLLFNTDVVFFISNIVFDRQVFQPEFNTGTTLSAFFSFHFLVSIIYLFADVSRGMGQSGTEEETTPAGTDTGSRA